ncbi:SpoIIE family protein phosphatase [Streptacidiphilus carbonis]|uniref:SpoIIE family protein phosphatase n=1 Tax=Streptacidiphilus carbonis TaxID=105422 RepID=UPI000A877505|nr:SpoIIE family protein phosphatase [Streptacidiphilus carbonis]
MAALLDDAGVVLGWSAGAEQFLGYEAAAVVGHPGVGFLSFPCGFAGVARRCRVDGYWCGPLGLRHRDGHEISAEVAIEAFRGSADRVYWLVAAGGEERSPGPVRPEGSLLEEFLARSPVGMAILDRDLRYVWVNGALEHQAGAAREHRLGSRPGAGLPHGEARVERARLRGVLETGEPVTAHLYRGHLVADPGREHTFTASAFRLDGPGGQAAGLGYVVLDVTEQRRARHRLGVLNEASARIGSTLDVMRTAQELAEVAVPCLADFVMVDLLESVLRGEEPDPGDAAGSEALIRAGQQSVREGCPEAVVRVGEASRYHRDHPIVRSLKEGRTTLTPRFDARASSWVLKDPARGAKVRAFVLRSAMVVPVCARGVTLGVATFMRWQTADPFEHDDLLLAQEFVARAAVCLDNARRYTREHHTALRLQHSLLPHHLPNDATLEVASRYLPAPAMRGVGGDWFDVIPLPGARTALVVGAVVGHGIHAAAAMGRLRTAVDTLAALDLPPEELLAHLDDVVRHHAQHAPPSTGAAEGTSVGATCLYLVYDPTTGRCTMAAAGHPAPAITTPDGTLTFPDLPQSPALGLGTGPFEATDLLLPEGTLIALYTEGLIKDRDPRTCRTRLQAALAEPQRPLEDLSHDIIDTLLPTPQSDDAAFLLARTHMLHPHQIASWNIPADPAHVARARALTTRQLDIWGLRELCFSTELIVSELVTNAIRHAKAPIQLRLIHHHRLICEVSDASSSAPHLRHARTTDEGGRGLFLIAQLSQRWGTRHTTTGKTIWTEQELPPPA